jgi:hypothetical protein
VVHLDELREIDAISECIGDSRFVRREAIRCDLKMIAGRCSAQAFYEYVCCAAR